MANFVDGVALVLPWAGGLVPAVMTYNNLVLTGVEPWQAGVVAAVVEGLGFVAVTTVIDFFEEGRRSNGGAHAMRPYGDGAFWIALAGAGLYLLAVVVINTFLDGRASLAKMVVGGILSTFGVLGGVQVALRNQLGKRRAATGLADEQAQAERVRLQNLEEEKARREVEFQQSLQVEQLRMAHELQLKAQEADSARKLEKVRAQVQAHETQSAPAVGAVRADAGQSEGVRKMVQCREPGCGMEYAAVGGKGGHYKKWHPAGGPPTGSPQMQEQHLGGEKSGGEK